MNIIELFPPGAIPEGDVKTRNYLIKINGVYERILDRARSISGSTPENENGPLFEDWKRITQSDRPKEALRRRCDYYRGENLSNTKEHFLKVDEDNKLEFENNKVTVYLKEPIKRVSIARSGMRIGRPLRTFTRPEKVIKKYEKMRHAHIIMRYKNAQN